MHTDFPKPTFWPLSLHGHTEPVEYGQHGGAKLLQNSPKSSANYIDPAAHDTDKARKDTLCCSRARLIFQPGKVPHSLLFP